MFEGTNVHWLLTEAHEDVGDREVDNVHVGDGLHVLVAEYHHQHQQVTHYSNLQQIKTNVDGFFQFVFSLYKFVLINSKQYLLHLLLNSIHEMKKKSPNSV